jgi:hypothetical protein
MDLPAAPDPAATLLLDGRLPALLTGLVLCGWGAKLYRVVVLAPGILAGVYLGAILQQWFHLTLTVSLVTTLVLAAAGALVCHFVEGLALRVAGAGLFGALVWLGWPLLQRGALPFWVPLVASVLGAVVFPYVYGFLLRPVTALVGAWSVAWAVKRPDELWLVVGLAVAGTAVQFWLDRGEGGRPAKAPKGKKPRKG